MEILILLAILFIIVLIVMVYSYDRFGMCSLTGSLIAIEFILIFTMIAVSGSMINR